MSEFEVPWGNYLLQDLVETAMPAMSDLWPQTLGWQIVALLLVLWLTKKAYLAWQTYQANAYRRAALAWLNNLPGYINLERQPIYRQLPSLLRKTALQAFGREQVIHLSADHWECWLDQQCDKTSFSIRCANYLQDLAYAAQPQLEPPQMQTLVNEISLWIKFHRRLDD